MISKRMKFLLFNFLGLQFTWAACAYGATHEIPLFGTLIGFSYIVLHFIFAQQKLRDLNVLIIIGTLGIIMDIFNAQFGVIGFHNFNSQLLNIPTWLVALWLVFSLMIPHSLYWLSKHLPIASAAGAIGGALSYWFGYKLGAIDFLMTEFMSFIIIFIQWGILFPLALLLVKWITTKMSSNNKISAVI